MKRVACTAILSAFVIGACTAADSPSAVDAPRFARAGSATCAASADFVVTDEAGLFSAEDAASPGDIIAIEGTISLHGTLFVSVPGLTLTCATPGSGLRAAEFLPLSLVQALESDVTVSNLVLDGSDTGSGAFRGFNTASPIHNVGHYTLSGNTVTCGFSTCLFTAGASGTVLDNTFDSPHFVVSGIHIQGAGATNPDGIQDFPTDGTRIVGNTFRTNVGSGGPTWGAIRLRDATGGALVADNNISGPWANGLGVANLGDVVVDGNAITDPANYGVNLWFDFLPVPDAVNTGNVIRRNRVSGSGVAAFGAADACGNTFVGNDVRRNELSVVFHPASGGNLFLGNPKDAVDNGALDCDGDGVDDPNGIPGQGRVFADLSIGQLMHDAAEAVKEMR